MADYLLKQASWEDLARIRALPTLPLAVDALTFEASTKATEKALSKLRHPSNSRSVDGVARTLDFFAQSVVAYS